MQFIEGKALSSVVTVVHDYILALYSEVLILISWLSYIETFDEQKKKRGPSR